MLWGETMGDNIEKKAKRVKLLKNVRDWSVTIVFALAVTFSIRSYALTRVDVDGTSMEATLENKDVMFEEKISMYLNNINRRDIITFRSMVEVGKNYIKRVIGLEGDVIELKDGKVFLNNLKLNEEYLKPDTITSEGSFLKNNEKYIVPKGSVFVMGDNRNNSSDGRDFGPVKLSDITGRVFVRVYPFSSFRTF
jgi:signal peptidase I